MSQFFPPYSTSHFKNIKVELDLSNYATKSDLKNRTHIDTSSFATKNNLNDLKTKVNKLDIDKLVPVPGDLAKLFNKLANVLTAKTDFNALKTDVDGIDTTKYDSEVGNLKLKISDIRGLLQTSTFNSKITEIEGKITTAEGKIPDISNLATKTEVTTVENKIPNISNLATKTEVTNVENKIPDANAFVKKTDYSTEITKIKNDYITNTALTSTLNDLTQNSHFTSDIKKVDDKANKNSSDILVYESRLKQKEDRIDELEREASFFRGGYYCNQQSYLLFEPKCASFVRRYGNIDGWKSTGIHNNSTNTDLISVSNLDSVLPRLLNQNNRLGAVFAGNLLKQDKIDYAYGAVINIYIVYKLQKRNNNNPDMTLENSLFGAVKITKNVDTSKYSYSGYGISFDSGGSFSFGNNLNAKNVIIFGSDMLFSSHKTNQTNNVYVLGKKICTRNNGTTLCAEKIYKTDFTEQNKKNCIVFAL